MLRALTGGAGSPAFWLGGALGVQESAPSAESKRTKTGFTRGRVERRRALRKVVPRFQEKTPLRAALLLASL